jgi:hypothetical protein
VEYLDGPDVITRVFITERSQEGQSEKEMWQPKQS